MFLKLAWRNIWRNKRRTAITLASIFFAVILSTLMSSMKEGVYVNMIKNSAGDFYGYAQIQKKGYNEERTLDFVFEPSTEIQSLLDSKSEIEQALPRLESFALTSYKTISKGALVVGIDQEKERIGTRLNERVVHGEYLSPNDNEVLIGLGLSEYLNASVGDTIVLLGQGYHGVSAAGKYRIKGIVKFGSPEISKQVVFLPLSTAQTLYGAEGLITNLVLQVGSANKGIKVAKKLKSELPEDIIAYDWQELNPGLVKMIETDRTEGYVFMFILYLVISFGIFGTILMMLAERKHEFGVLVAIGMKRAQLALLVWLEVISISILGAIVGVIGALPVCFYFYFSPIELGEGLKQMTEEYGLEAVLQPSVAPEIFINQGIIVFCLSAAIAIYPLVKLLGIDAIKQMRS